VDQVTILAIQNLIAQGDLTGARASLESLADARSDFERAIQLEPTLLRLYLNLDTI
jgi:hypothetical protein